MSSRNTIYLAPKKNRSDKNVARLRQGIKDDMEYYNNHRSHQRIAHQIPMERYKNVV